MYSVFKNVFCPFYPHLHPVHPSTPPLLHLYTLSPPVAQDGCEHKYPQIVNI